MEREEFVRELEVFVAAYEDRCRDCGFGEDAVVLFQNTLGWLALNDQEMGNHYANMILTIGGSDWKTVATMSKQEARRLDTGDLRRSDPRTHDSDREQGRWASLGGRGPVRTG